MKRVVFLLLVLLSFYGCATVYNPATRQNEVIFIDTGSEISLGKNIDRQIHRDYTISPDAVMQQRAKHIGAKIAEACERKDVEYNFLVLENKTREKEINAFSTPGGYIYIYDDLMDEATDDELAGVIAHEVGHIAAKHAVKRLQAAMGYDILMSIVLRGESAASAARLMNIVANLVVLGYSREDELEADRLAVRYTYNSNYDPNGLLSFMRKLQIMYKDNSSAILNFLRTHPSYEQRQQLLMEEVENIKNPNNIKL